MKGMKPATAAEAFQAKKQVALKKIERDFEDETIRINFEKFGKDARKLAAEFTPEELDVYKRQDQTQILSLKTLKKVNIPLHLLCQTARLTRALRKTLATTLSTVYN